LTETEKLESLYMNGTWDEESIRKTDPAVRSWEQSLVTRGDLAREWRQGPDVDPAEMLEWVVREPPPTGSFPVAGLTTLEDWHRLVRHPDWKRLRERDREGRVEATTTLD
jgi:hypothetical protein